MKKVILPLGATFQIAEKISSPHQLTTKTLYSQITLVELDGKPEETQVVLFFTGHAVAFKKAERIFLILDNGTQVDLASDEIDKIVCHDRLNQAYIKIEDLNNKIFVEQNFRIHIRSVAVTDTDDEKSEEAPFVLIVDNEKNTASFEVEQSDGVKKIYSLSSEQYARASNDLGESSAGHPLSLSTETKRMLADLAGIPLFDTIKLVDAAPKSGDSIFLYGFKLGEKNKDSLFIRSDNNIWKYIGICKPQLNPVVRTKQVGNFLHSRANRNTSSYLGYEIPALDKVDVDQENSLSTGIAIADQKGDLVGILPHWGQSVVPARIIKAFLQYPNQVDCVSLPCRSYAYSETVDVGRYFKAAGLMVQSSGCEQLELGDYITHVDDHPFQGRLEFLLMKNKSGEGYKKSSLSEYLFFRYLAGNPKVQLTVHKSLSKKSEKVSVDLFSGRQMSLLESIPIGMLPYLIIGPFVISPVFNLPYRFKQKFSEDFSGKKILQIVKVLSHKNLSHDGKEYDYQGWVLSDIREKNKEAVNIMDLRHLAVLYDVMAAGSSFAFTCYANKMRNMGNAYIGNLSKKIYEEYPETARPEKILHTLCLSKLPREQQEEVIKSGGFTSDRSSDIPSPETTPAPEAIPSTIASEPISASVQITVGREETASSETSSQTGIIQIPSQMSESGFSNRHLEEKVIQDDNEWKRDVKQSSVCIEAVVKLSSQAVVDPLFHTSHVLTGPGVIVNIQNKKMIVTVLSLLTRGFYSARITIKKDDGKKEILSFGREDIIFDLSSGIVVLQIPNQEQLSHIRGVELPDSTETVNWSKDELTYLAYMPNAAAYRGGERDINYKELKCHFIEFDIHKESDQSSVLCGLVKADAGVIYEPRGGGIYTNGKLVGSVVDGSSYGNSQNTLHFVPYDILRRILNECLERIEKDNHSVNEPRIVRSIVLPPPIIVQKTTHPAQKRWFFSENAQGPLIIHAEFSQTTQDKVFTEDFQPPSPLLGCLLVSIQLRYKDKDKEKEINYSILPVGKIEHPVYGFIPWQAIFSLVGGVYHIEITFYDSEKKYSFSQSFPIKYGNIEIGPGATPIYEKLTGHDNVLISTVIPYISYPGKLFSLLYLQVQRYLARNMEHAIYTSNGATVGYRVVQKMFSDESLFYKRCGSICFNTQGSQLMKLVPRKGTSPIFMLGRDRDSQTHEPEFKKSDIFVEDDRYCYSILKLNVNTGVTGTFEGYNWDECLLPYIYSPVGSSATGFVIQDNTGTLYVVSNAHALAQAVTVEVVLPEGGVFLELKNGDKVVAPHWDLTVLRIDKKSPLSKRLKPLPLAQVGEIKGDDFVLRGYPKGDSAQLVDLPTGNLDVQCAPLFRGVVPVLLLTYSNKSRPGSSGSPLINKQTGEVVGIHAEGYGENHKRALHVVLLHRLLEGISQGATTIFPATLPFSIPPTLPALEPQSVPRLTQSVPDYKLEKDDIISMIDGYEICEDDEGEVAIDCLGVRMSLSNYAYMQIPGKLVKIELTRGGEKRSIDIELPKLSATAMHTDYHFYSPTGGRAILLGNWWLTEEQPSPEAKKKSNRQKFTLFKQTKSVKKRIKLTLPIINEQQGDVSRLQRTELIDLKKHITQFFLISIIANGKTREINGFSDVLTAMEEFSEGSSMMLVVQKFEEGYTQELPTYRFTNEQVIALAEQQRLPRSMKPYCGLLVSDHILQEYGIFVAADGTPSGGDAPIDDVTRVHGIAI